VNAEDEKSLRHSAAKPPIIIGGGVMKEHHCGSGTENREGGPIHRISVEICPSRSVPFKTETPANQEFFSGSSLK
jgi:hypothetical protein